MTYDTEQFPLEPIGLWTVTDIAKELGVTDATVHYWGHQNGLPTPYALAGQHRKQQSRLWTEEQVNKIKEKYGDRRPGEDKAQEIIREDDLPVCSKCGDVVFDMTMHNRFRHGNELSVTRGKASW